MTLKPVRKGYLPPKPAIFDEMRNPQGEVRNEYQDVTSKPISLPLKMLSQKQREAEVLIRRLAGLNHHDTPYRLD